jgi:DHA1 family bicyclomycin/chloramphenicol resistance-like MFS transporter
MVYYHVTEQQYGWIFALVAAGLIGASQVNNFLLKRYASEQIFKAALTIQNLFGLLLVLSIITGWNNIYSSIGLIFCFLCCQGFLFPNASALSMAQFGHNAGSASALMGFIQMSVGALFSAFVSILQTDSPIAMTGVMAFCSLTASLIYSFGKKLIVKKASLILVEEEEVDMINTL